MTTPSNISFYESFLNKVPPFSSQMSQDAILELLRRLNNPQEKIQVIHIAGTNGKGSSTKMLSAIYQQSGLNVGTYTSPYIMDYKETITIGEQIISSKLMDSCTLEISTIYEDMKNEHQILPTKYECLTAVAFLAFAKSNLDICIIETLMGGKDDATNVVSAPLTSLITSISFDHTEYLGSTLESIAAHKAGIIKNGCPTVINKNPTDAINVVEQTCLSKHSPLIHAMDVRLISNDYLSILSLEGDHQLDNLAGVLTVIQLLQDKLPVSSQHIMEGLSNILHPCRLELMTDEKTNYLFDGSHNREGINALADFIETRLQPDFNIYVILGMLKDKDYVYAYNRLAPLSKQLLLTSPLHKRALTLDEISDNMLLYSSFSTENPFTIFSTIQANLKEDDILIICGSLYLAVPLKHYFTSHEKRIPLQ